MFKEIISVVMLIPMVALAKGQPAKTNLSWKQKLEEIDQRGPLPPWFFSPKALAGTRYAESRIKGRFEIILGVKAEDGIEAKKVLWPILDDRFLQLGFQRMDLASQAQFNKWHYKKTTTLREPGSVTFGSSDEYYFCNDTKNFQATLDRLEILNDRQKGKMTAKVRQVLLQVRVATGQYKDGTMSFNLSIEPMAIGTFTWPDSEVKEREVTCQCLKGDVFDPAKLFDYMDPELKRLLHDSEINVRESSKEW